VQEACGGEDEVRLIELSTRHNSDKRRGGRHNSDSDEEGTTASSRDSGSTSSSYRRLPAETEPNRRQSVTRDVVNKDDGDCLLNFMEAPTPQQINLAQEVAHHGAQQHVAVFEPAVHTNCSFP